MISANRSKDNPDTVVQSAIATVMNDQLVQILHQVVDGKIPLFVPSLSRISRNMDVLCYVIELLLAHDAQILTSNYLIRLGDACVRTGKLLPANVVSPMDGLNDLRGLSGVHRKVAHAVAQSLDAQSAT